jgi:nitrogen regulatory protein PII
MHAAVKVVIITERAILDRVTKIIEKHGATGYTYTSAGGKGSRGMRRMGGGSQVSGLLENVKIEVILPDHDVAERLTEEVAATYFDNYAGITYVVPVEILRPGKFKV